MQHKQSDLKSWLWVIALAAITFAAPEPAAADEITPDNAQTGSLLFRMQDGYRSAARLNTDVDMDINGLVARVSVRQEFRNTSSDWLEGIYVFPLPEKAAVNRLRLHIGERFIEGEIQEKEHAKKTYEEAKKAGKKASLVEQQRPNLFTTRVANIAPGELVVVEIQYLEDVRFEDGKFSIRFPMTLTPRYVSGTPIQDKVGSGWSPDTDRVPDASAITPPQVSASSEHRISLRAAVSIGLPLEVIASRYHPVKVAQSKHRYSVSLRSTEVAMDHDFELVWRPVPSAAPRAMAFIETVAGKPHVLLMMMPPDQELLPAATMPRETIFIVDTSGSMHGVSIQQAKRAVQLALKGLKPTDRFNVIEFNSVTRPLFQTSQNVTSVAIAEATAFVNSLTANGGTEMRPALSLALQSPPSEQHLRQIIFITDGSVGYEDEMFNMIESQLGGSRLFTVGIGSAPNSWFMQKAAEVGRGSYTFISALHEVQEKMDALFTKLEQPQVTDIEVQWPSGVAIDSFPAIVPDLYLGQPVTVKVAASGPFQPGDGVRIAGNAMGGAWAAELPVSAASESPGVAALWARARIAELSDIERRSDDADSVRAAIVETALQHHLVSKYTSLVAVDKTPARPAGDPLQGDAVPNLLPYGQSANAIYGFPATATNAPWQRLIGLMALLLAGCLVFIRTGVSRGHHAYRV